MLRFHREEQLQAWLQLKCPEAVDRSHSLWESEFRTSKNILERADLHDLIADELLTAELKVAARHAGEVTEARLNSVFLTDSTPLSGSITLQTLVALWTTSVYMTSLLVSKLALCCLQSQY